MSQRWRQNSGSEAGSCPIRGRELNNLTLVFPQAYSGKLAITPSSSTVSLGGCGTDQLAVTKPFRICVQAGRMCTCWEMERGGEKRRGRAWGAKGAAEVGTVREQGEMSFQASQIRLGGEWLTSPGWTVREPQPWPIATKHRTEECFQVKGESCEAPWFTEANKMLSSWQHLMLSETKKAYFLRFYIQLQNMVSAVRDTL